MVSALGRTIPFSEMVLEGNNVSSRARVLNGDLHIRFPNGDDSATNLRLANPVDLSAFRYILSHVQNTGTKTVVLRMAVRDAGTSDYWAWGHHTYGILVIRPGETKPLAACLSGSRPAHDYMANHFPRMNRLPGMFEFNFWRDLNAAAVGGIQIIPIGVDATTDRSIVLKPFCGALPISAPSEQSLIDGSFFPCIDKYGQYSKLDWPFKIGTDADFMKMRRKEEAWIAARGSAPNGWNQYGGWTGGPQLTATGHFRTEKHLGKWWFVDPDGRLFWSNGATGMGFYMGGQTPIEPIQRRKFFIEFPTADIVTTRNGSKELLIGRQNEKLKYSDQTGTEWKDNLTMKRARAFGLNTAAAWSSVKSTTSQKIPYTVMLHPWSSMFLGNLMDPFNEDFRQRIESTVMSTVGKEANDPWCIGYFINNETQWISPLKIGETAITRGWWDSSKIELIRQLKEKYETIENLNAAWASSYVSWDTFSEPGVTVTLNAASRQDLTAFGNVFCDTFFKTISEVMKQHAPNKLYLGDRFNKSEQEAMRACARYADVISFNKYDPGIEWLGLPSGSVDKPIIIGEFCFVRGGRRHDSAGLGDVFDPDYRGRAYNQYIVGALANPAIVGCHWFQWDTQPVTGRGDGENYEQGFIDTSDTPYWELAYHSRNLADNIYDIRFSGTSGFDYQAAPAETDAVSSITLIGGNTGNGNFNNPNQSVNFSGLANWLNIGTGGPSIRATTIAQTYNGTPYAELGSQPGAKIFAIDTQHSLTEGDVFDISYAWLDGLSWNDATDRVAVSLFVTSDNTITGTQTELATSLSNLSTLDNTYETFYQREIYRATAAVAGKRLFAKINTTITREAYAGIDNFELVCDMAGSIRTVTYADNGATRGGVPVSTDSRFNSGATVTVFGNTGNLVKTGNVFAGWNTAADGSGTNFAPNATFVIHANTTLYAQWQSPIIVNAGPDQAVTVNELPSLTPSDITAVAWYDAADTSSIAHVNGKVSQWNDKSGNQRHATQITEVDRPTYLPSDPMAGNQPSIGSNTGAGQVGLNSPSMSVKNVYTVTSYRDGLASNFIEPATLLSGGATRGEYRVMGLKLTPNLSTNYPFNDTSTHRNGSPLSAAAVLPLPSSILRFTSSTPRNQIYSLGFNANVLDRGWQGSYSEWIFTNGTESLATQQMIEGYLAHKWGLVKNLPVNHPYRFRYSASLTGSIRDLDSHPLSALWTMSGGPAPVEITNAFSPTTTFAFTKSGAYTMRLTASDGNTTSFDEVRVNVVLLSENRAPRWVSNPINGSAAAQDIAYSGSLAARASDPDGHQLTYTKVNGPAWLSVAANGALSGTPTSAAFGNNVFLVSVSDGFANAVPVTLNIISVQRAFDAWRTGESVGGGVQVAFAGDANRDGVPDGLAWLLGSPTASTNASSLVASGSVSDDGTITFSFNCLVEANRDSATLSLQHSNDLGITDPWINNTVRVPNVTSTVGGIHFVISATADPNIQRVEATVPTLAEKIFIRLMGNLPSP